MKKYFIVIFFIIFSKCVYCQSFDTLNFIDNFSRYVVFLDSTTDICAVCNSFKTSKYFDHKIERYFSKGYPEYQMNEEYYKKYKISEVDFITFCELDPKKYFLQSFAFYFPVTDSSYISDKLTNDGWEKESWPPNVEFKDRRYLFRKSINGNNYLIDNQKYPDEKTFRYYITIHDEDYVPRK